MDAKTATPPPPGASGPRYRPFEDATIHRSGAEPVCAVHNIGGLRK